MIKIKKIEDAAAYEYLRRHGHDVRMIIEMLCSLNGKTILEAANSVRMDTLSFMICLGHLYRTGIIKEVRIV